MRVKVTVVVEVETNVWPTAEEISAKVDQVCVGALERAGFDPVSCGYGYAGVEPYEWNGPGSRDPGRR